VIGDRRHGPIVATLPSAEGKGIGAYAGRQEFYAEGSIIHPVVRAERRLINELVTIEN
jgi:hypothetical protein